MSYTNGFVAQPTGGGERNGVKWELNRVYGADGKQVLARCFWAIKRLDGDRLDVRTVDFGAARALGVGAAEFFNLLTPLADVERWIAAAERARRGSDRRAPRRAGVPATV